MVGASGRLVAPVKRGRSTGVPTARQAARFDAIREAGCLVAHLLGLDWLPAEIHHLTVGGRHGQKRRGHDDTIGLNSWSHRGEPLPGWTAAECEAALGPSYARSPRAFRERFGDDDTLLAAQADLLRTQGFQPCAQTSPA